jgi:PAS domain S-box-containing protein
MKSTNLTNFAKVIKSSFRVLYLEDDRADVQLVRARLEDEGLTCNIIHVENRADFVAALNNGGFDVILADYRLPSFDGLEALNIAQQKASEVPFIFLSGTMGEELAIETLKKGATDYVLKQKLSRLGPAIRRALEEAEEHRERREAEKALEEVSRQNELILNSAGEGICGLDLKGDLTFVNSSAAQMLGYRVREIIGRHGHSVWHHSRTDGSPYPETECPICAACKDGIIRRMKNEVFWRKDGTSFPVAYTSTPILEGGKLIGSVITFSDITKRRKEEEELRNHRQQLRKLVEERSAELRNANARLRQQILEREQIEEELRQSKELYRAFINSSPDIVFVKDEQLRHVIVNRAFLEHLGVTEDQVMGKTDFELFSASVAEKCRQTDKEALESEGVVLSEETEGDRAFETYKFRINLGGNKFGVGGYIRDVTDRKHVLKD